MFCKYIGTIKFEDVATNVRLLLKQPGDLIAYHLESENSILHVTYRTAIVFFQGSLFQEQKPFICRPSTESDCYKNLKINNLIGDPGELLAQIQQRLITIVGFDFDLTLTKTHTFSFPDTDDFARKENLVYPKEIRLVLQELSKRNNIFTIIVSNNYKDKIKHYLNLWFPHDKFFADIFGRNEFHNQGEGDKEVCFFRFYKKICNTELLSSDGFVQVDKLLQARVVDVVCSYMVDDDPRPSFRSSGLKVIRPTVPTTRSFLIELKYQFAITAFKFDYSQVVHSAEAMAWIRHQPELKTETEAADEMIQKVHQRFRFTIGSLLICAVKAGFPALVKQYLQHGEDVNALDMDNLNAVIHACINNDIDILKLLLEGNLYDDKRSFVPIIVAAVLSENPELLSYILSLKRYDINAKDKQGLAPLHHACSLGNVAMIELLAEAGCNINLLTSDASLCSPLHLCVAYGKKRACTALLRLGADVTVKNINGFNPCQLAAVEERLALFELLLIPTGAHINSCFRSGRTLLTHSIESCRSDFNYKLMRFIKPGAFDFNLKDEKGDTPLSLAKKNGLATLVTALKTAGADDPEECFEESFKDPRPGSPHA